MNVIIPIKNQCYNIENIIKSLEIQSYNPTIVIFVFDRCDYLDKNKMNSNKFIIDYLIKKDGFGFEAGRTRDIGLKFCIDKYNSYDEVLFIDGDCLPTEKLLEYHHENLNRIDAPIVSVGRRECFSEDGKKIGDNRDNRYIFDKNNGKLIYGYHHFCDKSIAFSCNLAMNKKAIDLCYYYNKLLSNDNNRVFNSKFDGNWGLEDDFVGILVNIEGYTFSVSYNECVLHYWHDHNNIISSNLYKNQKSLRVLLRKLRELNKHKKYANVKLCSNIIGSKFPEMLSMNLLEYYFYKRIVEFEILGEDIIYNELVKKFKDDVFKLLFCRDLRFNIVPVTNNFDFKDNSIEHKNKILEMLGTFMTIKKGKLIYEP